MYSVRPDPLTSTVPIPGTFFALTVTEEVDEAAPAEALPAAAALLPAALGLELEPDAEVPAEAPHAATATAAPKITLPPSSRRAVGPEWGRTVVFTGKLLLRFRRLQGVSRSYGARPRGDCRPRGSADGRERFLTYPAPMAVTLVTREPGDWLTPAVITARGGTVRDLRG
jgi:hypothetical protein